MHIMALSCNTMINEDLSFKLKEMNHVFEICLNCSYLLCFPILVEIKLLVRCPCKNNRNRVDPLNGA